MTPSEIAAEAPALRLVAVAQNGLRLYVPVHSGRA
jgi:hypothetical protein